MTTKVDHPENTSVSHWLAELRMECYKKNLENFDTVKVSGFCNHPVATCACAVYTCTPLLRRKVVQIDSQYLHVEQK